MLVTLLPEFIEPVYLADQGVRLTGNLELSRMTRIDARVYDHTGTVFIDILFSKNSQGVRYIKGVLKAQLGAICQRCMELMQLVINTEVRLELIDNLSARTRMPDSYDPLLVTAEPIPLVELVEDELILALPFSPLHPDNECAAMELIRNAPVDAPPGPFAILSRLKSSK